MSFALSVLHGLNAPSLAALLLRLIVGGFFVLARFRWLYDPSRPEQKWLNAKRHEHLITRICTCGYGGGPALCDFVALVEISAGCALVAGLLTIPACLGLLGVLAFGTMCTAREKVMVQNPVDRIDCVSCYLWRVEGVYIAIVLSILALGPGAYSLDALLWGIG